jgi:hypothetical protein
VTIKTYRPPVDDDTLVGNPWLEYLDRKANLIDLFESEPRRGCESCSLSPIPGILIAMDDDYGIQRCDLCARYPGDLEAAQALADHLGEEFLRVYVVRYESEDR